MRIKRGISILLCLLMILPLGGCRYSDVLEQIIYDHYRAQEIDPDPPFEPEENDLENEDTSEDLMELATVEESERTEEQEQTPTSAVPGRANTSTQKAPRTTYNPSAGVTNGTAAEGSQPNTVTGEGEGAQAEVVQGNNGTGEGGTGEQGHSYSPQPEGAYKQVTDAFGEDVDIPENVNRVAAVGQLALVTLMLGGAGRLAATDVNTVSNAAENTAFAGLNSVEALWEGSGRSGMSDASFQRLLEIKPDVVLEISQEGTVNEAQAQQLAASGISYLVLPQMITADNVKTVMNTMGQVLGNTAAAGGTDAPSVAKAYNNWLDGVLNRVQDATKRYQGETDSDGNVKVPPTYTLYVDGWDSGAYYRLYNSMYTTREGYGCAYVNNSGTESCQGIGRFLSYANIVDTAFLFGITPKTQYMTPLVSDYRTMEVIGSMAYGVYPNGQKLLEYNGVSLGTQYLPSIIVPDAGVKAAIEANDLWSVYPHINTGNGDFNSDGFLDEDGHIVRTQVSGNYNILVNPRGLVSSWTEGGPEGILESLWAANAFFGAISAEELSGYIKDLYANFYGLELADSDIQAMLAGG